MYYSKQIVIYTIMIIKQLDYREGSWRLERTSQHLTTATVKEPPAPVGCMDEACHGRRQEPRCVPPQRHDLWLH